MQIAKFITLRFRDLTLYQFHIANLQLNEFGVAIQWVSDGEIYFYIDYYYWNRYGSI
jgi:hypothetical protein